MKLGSNLLRLFWIMRVVYYYLCCFWCCKIIWCLFCCIYLLLNYCDSSSMILLYNLSK